MRLVVFSSVLENQACHLHWARLDGLSLFLQCHSRVHSSSWFSSDAVSASSLVNSGTFSPLLFWLSFNESDNTLNSFTASFDSIREEREQPWSTRQACFHPAVRHVHLHLHVNLAITLAAYRSDESRNLSKKMVNVADVRIMTRVRQCAFCFPMPAYQFIPLHT